MAALTLLSVLTLAQSCQNSVSPVTIAGIAQHESGLDPTKIHRNKDGSFDSGLLQINSKNFSWLGLTAQAALDPCVSIAAGAKVLTSFSKYNTGSATKGLENGYALSVTAAVSKVRASLGNQSSAPPGVEMSENSPLGDGYKAVYSKPAHAGHQLIYAKQGN